MSEKDGNMYILWEKNGSSILQKVTTCEFASA